MWKTPTPYRTTIEKIGIGRARVMSHLGRLAFSLALPETEETNEER